MESLAAYVRGLDPHLPRTVWLVQVGGVVNALGNGIVIPFVVIYLHTVRGISFAEAGLALAFAGVTALIAGLGAGWTVDRIGGRNTLLLGLLLQAAAFAMFPLIREPWQAFALLGLEGVGTACFWPGQSTLHAPVPARRRDVLRLRPRPRERLRAARRAGRGARRGARRLPHRLPRPELRRAARAERPLRRRRL